MDVPQALQCLLEVYLLFRVEYPKQMKHTLSFIEYYLFKLRNGKKRVSISVLKMYNKFSQWMMVFMEKVIFSKVFAKIKNL